MDWRKKWKKCLVVGLLIIGYIVFILVSDLQPADKIQIAILLTLTSTFIVAWWQLDKFTTQQKETYFWNKKKLALVELDKTREPIADALEAIEAKFQFTKRSQKNPITAEEIHKAICQKYQKGGECKKMTPTGTVLRRHIVTLLGKYEYIATGINEDMFDIDVVKKLVKTPMIDVYRIFEPYVKHLRNDHNKPNVFKELEIVVLKFEDHEDTSAKPKYDK